MNQTFLTEIEKRARASALTVLLLALYLCKTSQGDVLLTLEAVACISLSLFGYSVHRALGDLLYWAAIMLLCPMVWAALDTVGVHLPWATLLSQTQAWTALGLFFGVTRLLGFGGPCPMVFSAPAESPRRM